MLGLGGLLAMATKQSRNRETRRANFVLRCATNAEGGWMLVLVLACGQTLPWHGGDGVGGAPDETAWFRPGHRRSSTGLRRVSSRLAAA